MDRDPMLLLSLHEELIDSVKDIFPDNSEFDTDKKKDIAGNLSLFCHTRVDWPLNNDLEDLNKRSKYLIIQISEEALEEFERYNQEQKEKAKQNLKGFISNQLSNFNPDPQSGEAETWFVKRDTIKLG